MQDRSFPQIPAAALASGQNVEISDEVQAGRKRGNSKESETAGNLKVRRFASESHRSGEQLPYVNQLVK